MHRITAMFVAAATGLSLAACTTAEARDPGPSAAPDTATETATDAEPTDHSEPTDRADREPRSEPATAPDDGAYGSEPFLDGLYDRCDQGDLAACDELFWEAPLDSEYEEFALERGAGGDEADPLAYVWSTMDAEGQEALCWETEKLGLDAAYDAFAQAYGDGAPAQVDFEQFVGTHCPSEE